MRLILEVISGPFQGKEIQAEVGQVVRIGRTTKSDVAMEDTFMSGEHFAVECDLRGCRIRDLNSRNGTQLNGQLITEVPLKEGDVVHAGKTDFKVRIADPKSPAAARPRHALTEREHAKPAPQVVQNQSNNLPRPAASTSVGPVPHPPDPPTVPEEVPPRNGAEPERVVPPYSVASGGVGSQRLEPEVMTPPAAVSVPAQGASEAAMDNYQAATPEGRLIQILSSQAGSLMALVDAVHDRTLLDLINSSGNAFNSLYRGGQSPAIAPYLVALPPRSDLLRVMVQKGWGRGWGVYLISPVSLFDLREFFRTSLMVTMPDGMELFSRFYDPKFFRTFLETCTLPEAEKFFGPIISYFMEDERREILLQFTKGRRGAEKRGHLLSVLP